MRDDVGSASVWVLALAMPTLAVAWATVLVGAAVSARHDAETAADFAALAAAGAVASGGDGCAAASGVAAANGGHVLACSVAADSSVTVTVSVAAPPVLSRWLSEPATATSRAGP